jgi:hypothetical protein
MMNYKDIVEAQKSLEGKVPQLHSFSIGEDLKPSLSPTLPENFFIPSISIDTMVAMIGSRGRGRGKARRMMKNSHSRQDILEMLLEVLKIRFSGKDEERLERETGELIEEFWKFHHRRED